MSIKFSDIEDRLKEALQKKLESKQIVGENGFVLIDGFIPQPIRKELSCHLIIGGPYIPMVGVIGKTTGMIYTFALKEIFPDINI